MTKIKSWFLILTRKTIVNRAFIVLLIAIPLLGLFMGRVNFENSKNDNIVYIYAEKDDSFTKALIKDLLGENDNYSFAEADSIEEIEEKVSSHKALCGFVLKKNQLSRVLDGKIRGNIVLIERTGNIDSTILKELFFSNYYREYTRFLTPEYLGLDDSDSYYQNYDELINENLLDFSIETIDSKENQEHYSYGKNIVSIVVFIFVLLIASNFAQENKNGIMYPVPRNMRIIFRLLYFLVPLLLLVPVLILEIALEGNFGSFIHEVVSIFLYVILVAVLGSILSYIIRSKTIYLGLIPVLTIAYIILCPTFVDLSLYFPIVKVLRLFCPPYFYMVF